MPGSLPEQMYGGGSGSDDEAVPNHVKQQKRNATLGELESALLLNLDQRPLPFLHRELYKSNKSQSYR